MALPTKQPVGGRFKGMRPLPQHEHIALPVAQIDETGVGHSGSRFGHPFVAFIQRVLSMIPGRFPSASLNARARIQASRIPGRSRSRVTVSVGCRVKPRRASSLSGPSPSIRC